MRRLALAAAAVLLVAATPASRTFGVGPRTPKMSTAVISPELTAGAFENPPMWARPQAYWVLNRDTTLDGAKRQMRLFAKAGIGGLTIEPGSLFDGIDIAGPHVPGPGWTYPHLSREWFGFLNAVLDEAQRLGMTAYLLDTSFTMSGSAKGRVAEPWQGGDPSLGWTTLREVVPGVAYETVTVPWWIDPLNPKAVDRAIALNYARHLAAVGKHFGTTLQALWSDEVSFRPTGHPGTFGVTREIKEIPWSSSFPAFFKARKGYALTPALLRHVYSPDVSDPESRRISFDYWDAVSARFADVYYGRLSRWSAKHGIGFIGQLLAEETTAQHFSVEGSYFRPAAQATIVSTDKIADGSWDLAGAPVCGDDACFGTTQKLASSVAHLFGRDRVHLEAYDLANAELKYRPAMLRTLLDHSIARGVNLIAPHSYDPAGGGYAEDNSLFDYQPIWLRYVARLQYLFSGGRSVPDVAVGYPIEGFWAGDRVDPEAWALTAAAVGSAGYEYDHVPLELLRDATIEGGRLTYGTQSYRALVVADWSTASLDVMRRIAGFVRSGGVLGVVGRAPRYEARGSDKQLTALRREVFGFDAPPSTLKVHTYGRGTVVFSPADVTGSLQELHPDVTARLGPFLAVLKRAAPPRVRVEGAPKLPSGLSSVEVMSYRRGGGDTYFVHAFPSWSRKEPGHLGYGWQFAARWTDVTLDVPASGTPQRWNAETGRVEPIGYSVSGKRIKIPLRIPPHGSAVIRLRPGPVAPPRVLREPAVVKRVDPVWSVAYSDGDTAEARAGPWSKPWFAGTARYRARVDIPDGVRFLDLGTVNDVAAVRVNGRDAGTRIWFPYRFDIGKLGRKGPDTIEVHVAVSEAAAAPNDPRYPSGLLGPLTLLR